MIFILVFVTALLLSLGLTPLAARLAIRTGAVDQPAPRRVHDKPTPRLGGLPIFTAFIIAIGVSLFYPRTDPNELTRLVGLLILTVLVFVVGVYDDYREMKPLPQLVVQIIAAAIAVASGVMIREIPNPLG